MGGRRSECIFFKEEADFVARGQEVVVAHMGLGVIFTITGRELCQRVVCKIEGGKEVVGMVEKGSASSFGKVIGDDEIAVGIEGSDLFLCEARRRRSLGRWEGFWRYSCWRHLYAVELSFIDRIECNTCDVMVGFSCENSSDKHCIDKGVLAWEMD